jgi:hypothetical protein
VNGLIVGVRAPIVTTPVYDTYWKFAAERQHAFFRHLRGETPLTNDAILASHRFTNVYRASDRVSQYLIQRVIYRGDQTPDEVFFRTLLFRIFNKIETWDLLEAHFQILTWSDFSVDAYDVVLSAAMEDKRRIYSAAYIMPSRAGNLNSPRKHRNHLRLLERMMNDRLPLEIQSARCAAEAFSILREYPLIGDFLGYQFFIDLNYGPLLNFSEMDFVIPGPGAIGGLRKCFSDTAGLSNADIIRTVAESQESEFHRRGLDFPGLWGRPLQLVDCQNIFCEVDKYSRIAHPEFTPLNGRTRIKQSYRASKGSFRVWYPPKWGINEKIPMELRAPRKEE